MREPLHNEYTRYILMSAKPFYKTDNKLSKTRLCHSITDGSICWNMKKYGKCSFAHSPAEVRSKVLKHDTSCWFYNHGGCSKPEQECKYKHVDDPTMRKPLVLQHPCRDFHLTGHCPRGKKCSGDHDYQLSREEWTHHFPTNPYPETYPSLEPTTEFVEFPEFKPGPVPMVISWDSATEEGTDTPTIDELQQLVHKQALEIAELKLQLRGTTIRDKISRAKLVETVRELLSTSTF